MSGAGVVVVVGLFVSTTGRKHQVGRSSTVVCELSGISGCCFSNNHTVVKGYISIELPVYVLINVVCFSQISAFS